MTRHLYAVISQYPVSGKNRHNIVDTTLVAHGASVSCKEILGGSGSMMYNNEIKGFEKHSHPFIIGDLDSNKTFIHVLDDTTLDILLSTRDTIIDFTAYLIKREKFLRSNIKIFSTGEEEMLAQYLKELNENNEHDFVLPKHSEPITGVMFEEGMWNSFRKNPRRLAQIEADKISYLWDQLIEEFSKHAIAGTQYRVSEGGFIDSEKAIRFLALETRFVRRVLATHLKEIMIKTPSHLRMLRVIPMDHDNLYYAFLLLPYPKNFPATYEEYRTVRGNFLEAVCLVTRLVYPDAKHVVGIAMESGLDPTTRSEDLLVFDCSCWSKEIEEQAKEDQKQFEILVSHKRFEGNAKEYPEVKPQK